MPSQLERFRRDGFVIAGRALDGAGVARMGGEVERIVAALPAGTRPENIRNPHEQSDYFLDLCLSGPIVDCAEQLLGPDLLMWGTYGFAKPPGHGLPVAWHQDGRYFPLAPMDTVTAWLAVDDADRDNGCLRMIPGSHAGRAFLAHDHDDAWGRETAIPLSVALPAGAAPPVDLEMKAGWFSLHDPYVIHGSPPNRSDRRRCGIQILYATRRVRLDTADQQAMGLDWRSLKLFHCRPAPGRRPYHLADRPGETLYL